MVARRNVSPPFDPGERRRFPSKNRERFRRKKGPTALLPRCEAWQSHSILLLILLSPAPVGLFFAAVMATAPTEDDIWRAVDRLGRKYRVGEFINYYLKVGRHLESEATATLHEQWTLARQNPVTAQNRWQILSLEIELALRGEAVDGLFRNATSITVAEQAALLQSGWKLSGFDWLPTVDDATGSVLQFSKGAAARLRRR